MSRIKCKNCQGSNFKLNIKIIAEFEAELVQFSFYDSEKEKMVYRNVVPLDIPLENVIDSEPDKNKIVTCLNCVDSWDCDFKFDFSGGSICHFNDYDRW